MRSASTWKLHKMGKSIGWGHAIRSLPIPDVAATLLECVHSVSTCQIELSTVVLFGSLGLVYCLKVTTSTPPTTNPFIWSCFSPKHYFSPYSMLSLFCVSFYSALHFVHSFTHELFPANLPPIGLCTLRPLFAPPAFFHSCWSWYYTSTGFLTCPSTQQQECTGSTPSPWL